MEYELNQNNAMEVESDNISNNEDDSSDSEELNSLDEDSCKSTEDPRDLINYKPLDPDEILQEIVSRKCNQSTLTTTINDDIRILERDLESRIQHFTNRSKEIQKKIDREDTPNSKIPDLIPNQVSDVKIDKILQLSRENRTDAKLFLESLRNRALKSYDNSKK